MDSHLLRSVATWSAVSMTPLGEYRSYEQAKPSNDRDTQSRYVIMKTWYCRYRAVLETEYGLVNGADHAVHVPSPGMVELPVLSLTSMLIVPLLGTRCRKSKSTVAPAVAEPEKTHRPTWSLVWYGATALCWNCSVQLDPPVLR